eukprot:6276022-Karenia_brevis.AAC.1
MMRGSCWVMMPLLPRGLCCGSKESKAWQAGVHIKPCRLSGVVRTGPGSSTLWNQLGERRRR